MAQTDASTRELLRRRAFALDLDQDRLVRVSPVVLHRGFAVVKDNYRPVRRQVRN